VGAGVHGASQAKTVIRGGYGWFFDRFAENYLLQAIRQNGVNQQQYVIQNPASTRILHRLRSLPRSAMPAHNL